MKLVLHDFSGHPFQAELSRQLADRGHTVEHLSAAQYVSGKGHLERQPDDSPTLTFDNIAVEIEFKKYSALVRLRFEWMFGRAWIKKLKASPPDAVIACNIPLVSMFLFARHARRARLPYVMWHQDIYSAGLRDELHRRFPRLLARLGGWVFERAEAYCARRADHVVAIGDAFKEVYPGWKVDPERVTVIPNWAPLDEVYPVERDNHRTSDLFDDPAAFRLVYAGTLGRKHNPELLIDLVRNAADNNLHAAAAVISEGEAADDLRASAATNNLPLTVLPFQPADDLPAVLSSADVLVALLEPDATRFSIPSKVLSYMAAGRPILGLMPADNPAAVDTTESGGFVAEPTDVGAKAAGSWLAELSASPELVSRIGAQTRAQAERKFDVDLVTTQFETILTSAMSDHRS